MTNSWRKREIARFIVGTYKPVPWHGERFELLSPYWFVHFPHVSTEDSEQIAFTPDERCGQADRQTRMRPGRYLSRFYGKVLSEKEIREWSQTWASLHSKPKLHFATTADDIEEIYCNGPSSCMAHPRDYFSSPIHPVRVYAAGDLAVAYIKNGKNDITARTICWPEKRVYSVIYGDESRLEPALIEAGFTKGSLVGARLTRYIDESERYVVPYVDNAYNAYDNGTHLIIGDGDIALESTNGLSSERYDWYCDNCGDGHHEYDESFIVDTDYMWCHGCYQDNAFHCYDCEESHSNIHGGYTNDKDEPICEWCAENYAQCGECSSIVCSGDINEHDLCPNCEEELYADCNNCGERTDKTDLTDDLCPDCEEEERKQLDLEI